MKSVTRAIPQNDVCDTKSRELFKKIGHMPRSLWK